MLYCHNASQEALKSAAQPEDGERGGNNAFLSDIKKVFRPQDVPKYSIMTKVLIRQMCFKS